MLEIKHVGGRVHPVTGDQYNAFEMTEGVLDPRRSSSAFGPVLPVGHVVFTKDGKAYEVVASRTIESTRDYQRQYQHSYLCREADPRSL